MAQLIHDDLTDIMKKSNVVGDDATSNHKHGKGAKYR
jgi:hypothetical protein